MKKITATILMALSFNAFSAPSDSECEVTKAVSSPTGGLIGLGIIILAADAATSGAVSLFMAGSSYRASKCPRPTYVTTEQFNEAVAAEVRRQLAEQNSVSVADAKN